MPFILALFFGGFSAAFALILELAAFTLFADPNAPLNTPFGGNILTFAVGFSLVLAAIIEEASKLLFIRQFFVRYGNTFSRNKSALLLPLFFGIGFALPETLLAINLSTFSFWILGSITLHILTVSILFLSLWRSLEPRSLFFWGALFLVTLLHILYNFTLFSLA